MKKCTHCKEIKPIDSFYKNKSRGDGFTNKCKECIRKRDKIRLKNGKWLSSPESRKKRNKRKHEKRMQNGFYKKRHERYKLNGYYRTPSYLYRQYKHGAKSRDIDFFISKKEFISFWQRKCSYCGDQIGTIGLDRVDNTQGYVLENIVACCTRCNWMKRTYTRKDFIEHCKKIVETNL